MAMTIEGGTRDLFNSACRHLGRPLCDITIGELGNQRVKTYTDIPGMDRAQSAKSLLTWLGAKHLSLDSNGQDGAYPQDLSKPLDAALAEWIGKCDIVTNCGTSEHVMQGRRQESGQYHCFRNMHMLCKPGGIMAHGVPHAGSCRRHGHWKYTSEWFANLAKIAGYTVLENYTRDNHDARPQIAKGAEIYAFCIVRKKRPNEFPPLAAWTDPPRE